MDDMPTKELVKKQLSFGVLGDIILNGDIGAFTQNRKIFQKELEYQDLECAALFCEFRLSAITQLITMQTDASVNNLVQTMKKEVEASGHDYYDYIRRAKEIYKKNHNPQEVDVAADILSSIAGGSRSHRGRYFLNLQKRIATEQNPGQFLEQQKAASTALLNTLKEVMEEEWGTPPQEEEYDADRDCGIAWIPHRKNQ